MNKKIYLENLPKKGNSVDWESSVGISVKFDYNGLEVILKIIGYNKGRLKIINEYGDIFTMKTGNFKNCRIGNYIEDKNYNNFKYNIGDIIFNNDKSITILKKFKNKGTYSKIKKYKYKCNHCGNIGIVKETCKIACACCDGRETKLGINTIWDTDRWMMDLGVSEEDAKKYRICYKNILVKCPDCNNKFERDIVYIKNSKSISCPCCRDGISFPEKIMISILNQNDIIYKKEYSPEWIKPKRYDFYFELNNKKYIIEMDGEFHYIDNGLSGQSHEMSKEIDEYKDLKAKENGIKVIRIDCQKSELEYIKNNILKSELNDILDFKIINWTKVVDFASSSMMKLVWKLWKTEKYNTTGDLANYIKSKYTDISAHTVSRYLKIGNESSIVDYNPVEEGYKVIKSNAEKNSRQVEVFKDELSLGVFDSGMYIERNSESIFGVHMYSTEIYRVCNGIKEKYKGFFFKYVGEYKYTFKSNSNTKKVEVFKDNISIGIFDSCNGLSRDSEKLLGVKLLTSKISCVCNGKRKSHKGFTFVYI